MFSLYVFATLQLELTLPFFLAYQSRFDGMPFPTGSADGSQYYSYETGALYGTAATTPVRRCARDAAAIFEIQHTIILSSRVLVLRITYASQAPCT